MDIGTSSVKAVLYTDKGNIVKSAHGVFAYSKKADEIVELLPDEYIKVCLHVINELAAEVSGQVAGICASSASGNLLLLDKENRPLTNIISWQDSRVKGEAEEILGDLAPEKIYDEVGWPMQYTSFPLAQMAYLKKHHEKLIESAGTVCMSTEYLYFILTGKWGISTSAGTPFFFINQTTGEYIPELMERFGLTKEQFLPVKAAGEVLGGVREEVAQAAGVLQGTPVVLGTFDHPSAARGVGVLEEGQLLLSCGTSWVAFFPVKDRQKAASAQMLIDPFLAPKGGCWGAMVSVASVSERIWMYVSRYIDSGKDAFRILSGLAKESEPGAGGLVICPVEDPCDEKILCYPKKHIARAIMEGTIRLLQEKLEGLAEKGISAYRGIMVGGPSEDPYWIELMQEMCDIRLKVVHGKFAGAVGAAVLAGIGADVFESEKQAWESAGETE